MTQPAPTTNAAPATSAAAPGTQPAAATTASVDASAASGGTPEAASGVEAQATEAAVAPVDKLASARAVIEKAKKGAARAAQMRAERAQAERQAQIASADAQRWKAEAEARARTETALRQDPISALRALGYSPKDAAEAIKNAGTPEAALADVRKELEAERQARQTLENNLRTREQQATYEREAAAFMTAASDEKAYPTLSQQPPKFVLSIAESIIRQAHANTGIVYSNKEVLEYLESNWSSHSKAAKKPPEATTAASAETPGKQGTTPRTMTNGTGSKGFTLPADFQSLPDREQKEWMARKLAATSRKT